MLTNRSIDIDSSSSEDDTEKLTNVPDNKYEKVNFLIKLIE
jgi:hypothetical protein